MKRIAVALMMVVFMALALTGCMPMGGADGGEDSSGGLLGILPLILIIVVFYFILIRPQNKKNKQVAQMRDSIKRGDWVTSIGGLKGRVVRVKEDLLTIEVGSDKVKLDIMRWGISKIDEAGPEKEKKATTKAESEKDDKKEEDEPKRKPKKLTAAPKKEEEPASDDEDLIEEGLEELEDELEDEEEGDKK